MPTILSHAVAGAALGCAAASLSGDRLSRGRLAGVSALAAVLPDLDGIGFWFGVPYSHLLGHRGLSHSLLVSGLLGLLLAALLLRSVPRGKGAEGGARLRMAALLACVCAGMSHGLLDAMTSGGLGVALLAPFDEARIFFPFTPIPVSPLHPAALFTERGASLMGREMLLVWLPAAGVAVAAGLVATFRPSSRWAASFEDGA